MKLLCTHEHRLFATQPFPAAVGRADDQEGHLCCGEHECRISLRFLDHLVEVSDLVGQVDIAEMLGVGVTAVGNWRVRKPQGFPDPIATINKNNAVYSRRSIEEWAKATGRWGR